MMSILEQRQIIESAFLPLQCRCSIEAGDTVAIQIRSPEDGQVLLDVTGIERSELSSSRSISQLVLSLRHQLGNLGQSMGQPQRASSFV
ncbi:DUF1652 domain-containing protein [Pseudomonas sp. CrR14]|nr:DUF1652 domain-containing protein [Pseudomonas sp. CrR14]